MAVTNLGSASVNNASTTVAATCANAAAAGALVVVFVYDANNGITGNTVTDSGGNSYTLARSASPTANFFVAVFTSVITTSLTTSDTITYHCGNRSCVKQLSLVSALGYGAVDPATTNSAVNFSTAYSVAGAGAAAVVNELYLGFVFSLATPAAATGWTTNPPTNPSANFYAAWRVNSGTGALTFNGAVGSQWWAAIIVSFQPSLTTNFASLAATEARDVAAFPATDDNLAALAVTEARDVAHFIFPNLGALAVTEARDRAFFRTPGVATGLSAVRVALTGERSSSSLEGNL